MHYDGIFFKNIFCHTFCYGFVGTPNGLTVKDDPPIIGVIVLGSSTIPGLNE